MLQGFYLVCACVKRPFCVRKLPLLSNQVFFHSGRKTPLLPTQYQGKCLLLTFVTPPPPYTQTQTHIPGPMHAMRASKHGGNCWDLSLHFTNHLVTHVQMVFHHQTSKVCTIEL